MQSSVYAYGHIIVVSILTYRNIFKIRGSGKISTEMANKLTLPTSRLMIPTFLIEFCLLTKMKRKNFRRLMSYNGRKISLMHWGINVRTSCSPKTAISPKLLLELSNRQ